MRCPPCVPDCPCILSNQRALVANNATDMPAITIIIIIIINNNIINIIIFINNNNNNNNIIKETRLTWAYSWPCPPANLPWVRTAEIIRTAVKFTW